MIQASIYIQYRSQLERTRGGLMNDLDTRIHQDLQRVSGRLLRDGGLPVFEIDEKRICFSLELAGTLEALQTAFARVSRELFGVCVLVQRDPVRESVVTLRSRMNALIARDSSSIIWCDADVARLLAPWASFREPDASLLPLANFSFPPKASTSSGFWQLSAIPELLSSLMPKGLRASRVFSVISAPKDLGVHFALQEQVHSRGNGPTAFTVIFGEVFHPLHAIARAIAQEEEAGDAANTVSTHNGSTGKGRDTPDTTNSKSLFEELERSRLLGTLPLRMERSVLALFGRTLMAWARRCRLAGQPALLCFCGLEHLSPALEQALLAVILSLAEGQGIHILASAEGRSDMSPWTSAGARLERPDVPDMAGLLERASRLFPRVDSSDLRAVLRDHSLPGRGDPTFLKECYRRLAMRSFASPADPYALAPLSPSCDELELLSAFSLLEAFLPGPDALAALRRAGLSDGCLERGLVRLSQRGYMVSPEDPRCILPLDILPDLSPSPEHEAPVAVEEAPDTLVESRLPNTSYVKTLVEGALVAEHDKGGLRASAALLALFNRVGAKLPDSLFLEALEHDFSRMASALFSLDAPKLAVPDSVPQARRELFSWLYTGRSVLLNSALGGDSASAERFFSRTAPSFNDTDIFTAIADLNRANWFYLKGSLVEAGNSAKQALIRMQGYSDALVLPRLYCQVALIEISRERIREGLDYLGFAVESAEHSVLPEELIRALSLAAVGEFLWGNLARAERLIRRALSLSRSLWYDEWEDWTRFFLGRILFETGRYRDAIDTYDEVIADIARDEHKDPNALPASPGAAQVLQRSNLCRVWRYRALVHSGSLSEAPPAGIPVAGDLGLFVVEALCLRRDYRAALERAQELIDSEGPVHVALYDRPSWNSGFDWIDNRYLVTGGIRLELLKVFSNLARANSGESEQAVENMRKMIKEDRLSELDSSDAFSYWVYSHCLYLFGAESVDYGTVLSLAFKRFQRRSSRIDDLDTKRAFMGLHRWNAMLVQDAKKANLL